MSLLLVLFTLAVLLVLSAVFSGSETAITGTSEGRMHTLAKSGDKRAKRVLKLLQKKERLIGTLLTGNNLMNVTASALAAAVFIAWFGEIGVLYATIAMTLTLLIFAELLPKSYAILNPDKTALVAGGFLVWVVRLLWPVTWLVQVIVKAIAYGLRLKLEDQSLRREKEEELRGFIDLHDGEDPDLKHERKMMHSILDLDNTPLENIMTHRKNVTMIDLDIDPQTNITKILESPHTRIPLYHKQADDIKGVLHVRALLRALNNGGESDKVAVSDLAKLAKAPWFVPETATLLDQLQAFRERREHFAIVVDEYGSFMGIVTLEDVLEQIVGAIEDETDLLVAGVERCGDGSYIMDGSLNLREINREFDWQLPDDKASTLAGLVLHEARIIPNVGQVYEFYDFRFEITERQRQQITKIKVTPPPHTAEEASQSED